MKILLAAQQSKVVYPIPAYGFWAEYLRNGLAEAGHVVIENEQIDWARGLLPLSPSERSRWLDESWSATTKFARDQRPDLLLGYFFPSQVAAGAVAEIQAAGVPCVNFFCDNVREFREPPAEFRPFALHWVPEFEAVAWYEMAGWPCVHAPMPAWVPAWARTPPDTETLPPTFIGTHDILREVLLGQAVALGMPLEIRGGSWAESGFDKPAPETRSWSRALANQWTLVRRDGWRALPNKLSYRGASSRFRAVLGPHIRTAPASGEELLRTLRGASVAVGVNRFPSFRHPFDTPASYSRLRDIEAPMTGACYVTEWAPGLDRLYDLEKEVLAYRTPEELAATVGGLLADAERRKALRQAAQRRALSEHTIARSIGRISAFLGVK
ncbi:hypothetical protein DB347_18365 [Opitutaceae bacterium EW11]|nr:hypothetical protein DB347_18365 [Opitutaceae bacterium EW11]